MKDIVALIHHSSFIIPHFFLILFILSIPVNSSNALTRSLPLAVLYRA
jgi:hypothetical protein